MKARLVRIGDSRGVRLPKPPIEEAGLGDEVELHVREGAVVIMSTARPRAGLGEATKQIRQRGEDRLREEPTLTHFDEEDWEW